MKNKFSAESEKLRKQMLLLYIVFLAVLSVGIFMMPVGSLNKDKTMLPMYMSGTAFWLGIFGTVSMIIIINRKRKKNQSFNERFGKKKQLGLIHFFRNKEALIADISMFISVIGFVIVRLTSNNLIVSYAFAALFVFTFGLHCLLNGINYKYLRYKVRRVEKS